ncbi:uncharacterized protein LOC123517301 [Portunus trituberculatus]|nr:uncharacterized protein LOC123517301 [Portunus trituberculatus]
MNWLLYSVFIGVLCSVQGRSDEDGRIVAKRTTKTAIVLTTSTTTTPFTCAFLTNNQVCQRRRFRRYQPIYDEKKHDAAMVLDGSHGDDAWRMEEGGERDPRIALTVWTTVSSTYTVTATSTNTATTFSLSFYCTVNGASFPPSCG